MVIRLKSGMSVQLSPSQECTNLYAQFHNKFEERVKIYTNLYTCLIMFDFVQILSCKKAPIVAKPSHEPTCGHITTKVSPQNGKSGRISSDINTH